MSQHYILKAAVLQTGLQYYYGKKTRFIPDLKGLWSWLLFAVSLQGKAGLFFGSEIRIFKISDFLIDE